ncbi:MAG TPA: amidohydrolase family protein [Steroidobacteraceae bacterium]|nr:amidohydrolase family protein [Steroidobacteraceae bacterium]
MDRKSIAALCLFTTLLSHQVDSSAANTPSEGPTVLITDRAFDGVGGTLHEARIHVKDGKIASLSGPVNATAIDLRGYTVLPGWIDAHVHIASHFDRTGHLATSKEPPAEAALEMADAAWRTLMAGFTTVQSVGDPSEGPLRDAIRDHDFPGPRLLTSLAPIEGNLSSATPDQLRAMVRERKEQGADLIKIFASSSQRVGAKPTLTPEQLDALCSEAKAVGLRSMVHAYRGQVAVAARAGCREIEHATYATPEELQVAVQAGAYLTPQVGLVVQNYIENQSRYIGIEGYTVEGMTVMLRDMPEDFAVCTRLVHMPGAKLVFGTDATAGAHGHNAEEFIGRVQHCGQSPMAALVSANSLAAEAIGLDKELGRLAPGYAADIIALDGNPLEDITAVRRVVFVMRGGKIYKWLGSRLQRHATK